jgi:signal transduction histidine kinase
VSSVRPGSAPEKTSVPLNRLTLCFEDSATERDFRLQRAEASRPLLRRFIVFMAVLIALFALGIRSKLGVARAAGLPVPPQLDLSATGIVFGAGLGLLLFLGTLSRRFSPYLHSMTAVCMAGLVLVDNWHHLQLPVSYALSGTLLTLVVIYVASQLRFVIASTLGVVSSLTYLCCLASGHGPVPPEASMLQLQVGVSAMLLGCANLLLMFVTHQRELLARLAYYRARLLEQRGAELEAALHNLKQAELQLVENEKQATVGRLVAGILHEMNSPVGALTSATQTLDRALERLRTFAGRVSKGEASRAEAHDREFLSLVEAAERLTDVQAASSKRIVDVIEGLKQFVSLDQAALQVSDVRSGLETAVALARPGLPRGVELTLAVPECPIWVQCFPAKLNQVFLNLLKNASSAFDSVGSGSAAGGSIFVSATVAAGRLRIAVQDTGKGIEEERLERIFELDFSRQGSRVKLRLGLPASRGVVEAIGGTLRIESQVGRGSSAIIELPLGETPRGSLTPALPRGAAVQAASVLGSPVAAPPVLPTA